MSLNTDESTLVIPSIPSLGKRVTFPKSLSAQPPEKHTLNAWDPPNSETTSRITDGIKSLRCLGRRMTSQSLGWKLFNDLEKEGIGTNELESLASKMYCQWQEKLGIREAERIKFEEHRRDGPHLERITRIKKLEAKVDWKIVPE